MKIPFYVEQLVLRGVEVTIVKDETKEEGYYFDLNLRAKSGMCLYSVGDNWFVDMRYDETICIENMEDLYWAAKSGMHGRNFIDSAWGEILIEEGILKKKVETKVSYC